MPLYHVDPGSEAALIKVNDDVDLIKISVGTMDNNAYLIHPGAGPAILVDAAAEPGRLKALIGDDEVEGFDGDFGVVFHLPGPVIGGSQLEAGLLVDIIVEFLAAQEGIEALDGADSDAGHGVKLAGGQVLDVVELLELAAGIGCNELVELRFGLSAKV